MYLRKMIFRLVVTVLSFGAPIAGQALVLPIDQMTITGGMFSIEQFGSTNTTPITGFGPDTNLVSGYIGNGGSGLAANVPDPNSILEFSLVTIPVNVYTAAANLGDDNTAAGTVVGGPAPMGTLDNVANTISMDLSSWFMNWNDSDIFAGTGKADGVTSLLASGSWDPGTRAFTLTWTSLLLDGPAPEIGRWELNGVAAPATVPLPAAVWLFGSGLLGLIGIMKRRNA